MPKVHIGDVVVHKGDPPGHNPYRGVGSNMTTYFAKDPVTHVSGDERIRALSAFKHGKDTKAYTFWYAPAFGGAYRLQSPDEIGWETSGIK